MGIRFKMAQPMIPGGLLHTMYEVQAGQGRPVGSR